MHLILVRHGESTFNAQGRIQGQANPPLSELGERQAQAIADCLSKEQITLVVASPLARAHATAVPLAQKLGLELQLDDRLKEIHAGMFQGLKWSEIESLHPVEARHWLAQEPDFVIPGGESRRHLMERGYACLSDLRERAGHARIAVVAHGGVLAGALKGVLRVPAELTPFSLYNGSISRLEWGKKVKLLTLNETEHLPRESVLAANRGGDL